MPYNTLLFFSWPGVVPCLGGKNKPADIARPRDLVHTKASAVIVPHVRDLVIRSLVHTLVPTFRMQLHGAPREQKEAPTYIHTYILYRRA